jgi:hypothetical protein
MRFVVCQPPTSPTDDEKNRLLRYLIPPVRPPNPTFPLLHGPVLPLAIFFRFFSSVSGRNPRLSIYSSLTFLTLFHPLANCNVTSFSHIIIGCCLVPPCGSGSGRRGGGEVILPYFPKRYVCVCFGF